MTRRWAIRTAASHPEPHSRTSPPTGSAPSAELGPPTSAPSSRARLRPTGQAAVTCDYDWIVVGSGFGGAGSAPGPAKKRLSPVFLDGCNRIRGDDIRTPDLDKRQDLSGTPNWAKG